METPAASLVPGAGAIGFAFDAFGKYSTDSATRPMFDINAEGGSEWEYNGHTYILPKNVSVSETPDRDARSYAFESREEVQNHFSAKVDLKFGYRFFTGEFGAMYSKMTKSDVEYRYGLVEMHARFWELKLKDRSPNAIAQAVKDDVVYKEVPEVYTPENRELFFRFFDKYGTVYLWAVKVGARLYYSSSVEKSHGYSREQIEVNFKIEYNAAFVKAGAESKAEWDKVGEKWASSREVVVRALGGNTDILNAAAPSFGDNFNGSFNSWLASSSDLPGVIEFSLATIAELFPQSKVNAVTQAIGEYTKSRLMIESRTGSATIVYDAKPIVPAGGGKNVQGFQIGVFERGTLQQVFAQSYSFSISRPHPPGEFKRAHVDLQPYLSSKYVIAFTTWSLLGFDYPPEPFVEEVLKKLGASQGIRQWKDLRDLPNRNPNWDSCDWAHCNYVMVGVPGEGALGVERFERAGSCDTGSGHWSPGMGWYALPAPALALSVDLYKFNRRGAEL